MNPNANPYTPGVRVASFSNSSSNKENISPMGYFASPARDLEGRKALHDVLLTPAAATTSIFAKPPPLQTRPLEDASTPARTPSRQLVSTGSEQRSKGRSAKKSRSPTTAANDMEEDIRRVDQRNKQIGYGFNTDGYRNMLRLVESDPCLTKGGVIPLAPPSADVKVSKRTWDMLIRKWRRMLHMFDNVYIDEDPAGATMDSVQHAQRLRWISPVHLEFNTDTGVAAVPALKSPSLEAVMALRASPSVPTKMPIEESMQHLLRHPSCYEPVSSVIPDSLLYHSKGAQFSPTDIGIKVVVAPSSVPSQYASARSPSPEAPDFAPTASLAKEGGSPRRCASPSRISPDQSQSVSALSPTRKLDATMAAVSPTRDIQAAVSTDSTPAPKAPANTPHYSSRRYRAINILSPTRALEGHTAAESPVRVVGAPFAFPWVSPQQLWAAPSPSPAKKTGLSASAPHFTPNLIKSAAAGMESMSPRSSHNGGPSLSPQPTRSNTHSEEPTTRDHLDDDTTTVVAE